MILRFVKYRGRFTFRDEFTMLEKKETIKQNYKNLMMYNDNVEEVHYFKLKEEKLI